MVNRWFPTVVGNLFINSRKCIGVNGEALQLHAVLYCYYKSRKCPYQVLQVTWKTHISTKSRENPYQVRQVTWESVSGTASHVKIHIRYCKSHEKPVSVLQVTRKSISGTASHASVRIRHCKSRTLCLNVQWNRRFIWLTHYHHSTKLYWKKKSLVRCR